MPLYAANLWFVVSMHLFVSFVCLGIVRDIHWCLVLLLTALGYFRLSFSLLFRLYFLILCRSFCPICSLRYGFFSVVCFHWCFVVWMKIINELCGCLMWHTTICLPILWQWYIGNFLVFFQFIRCKLKCMNVLCYCCLITTSLFCFNSFDTYWSAQPFCATAAKTTPFSSVHSLNACRRAQPPRATAAPCLLAILAIHSMRIDRRNHPLLCTAVPWQFCCLLSLLSKCTTIQCYVCHGIAFAAPVRVVVSGLLIMVDCEGLRKFGSMEWWLKTKKWDCFLFRGISCRWYIVWGRCRSIFCVHDSKACHSIDGGTIERWFQNWQRQGLGCLISCVTRGIICCFTIVSKGRKVVKKRDSTLDFYTKVIIVVCTLVKVYNMKKKTELIVTVVSITSLYF